MSNKHYLDYIVFTFLAVLPFFSAAQTNYWVQFMPNDDLWFRVITDADECPTIAINNNDERQTWLYEGKTQDFPMLSCAFSLSERVQGVTFNSQSILMPKKNPERILIIGDTGCRIKGLFVQDCKNDWPLQKVSELAVQHNPDLIIHLGDYLYRDFCRSVQCKDEKLGDNWEGWKADFFEPATKLLQAAPWVMVRGNHELCARGGKGWMHFFDDRAVKSFDDKNLENVCYDSTDPYSIELSDGLRLIVSDSADDKAFLREISKINDLAQPKKSWLLTHRPLWSKNGDEIRVDIAPEKLSNNIQTIFSGHIHIFQLLEQMDKKQVIVGNSGSALYTDWNKDDSTIVDFGFVVLDKTADNKWKLNLFNVKNELVIEDYIN